MWVSVEYSTPSEISTIEKYGPSAFQRTFERPYSPALLDQQLSHFEVQKCCYSASLRCIIFDIFWRDEMIMILAEKRLYYG